MVLTVSFVHMQPMPCKKKTHLVI